MNMNDANTLYSTAHSFIDDFLLLSYELGEAVRLMILLDDCIYADGIANNPTVMAMKSAIMYLNRISHDFSDLDPRAENLIKPLHDYLTIADRSVQEGE